ncbi:hypothetical protein ASPZODRAFT_17950 [Penicilliopsis zonata CBS 506.65]|uniref:Aromatic prenyltransferase (DMATS family) n=1 Tax=Penicilliopsis zonata CBS 506.65 TaxID=1073090 RepID=A0A1L9SCX4_9EURO|nr:hypothetical protein ASPZODRAFT_17950 [Penicilliopsis zonata CBS 506.65]OJJ45036.1 hypothetical protein ASPZODRAFT_17950 [Penicilliopsis zonata CBS 506.65]
MAPSPPSTILSNTLVFPNDDQRFWWDTIAPTMQNLMTNAQYETLVQLQHLLFIYRHVLPIMGPRPRPRPRPSSGPGSDKPTAVWRSFMCDDTTPLEISVNFHDRKATVRLGFEPIGPDAGTPLDPFNQRAVQQFVQDLETTNTVTHWTWYRQLSEMLLVSPADASVIKAQLPASEHQSQHFFGFGFVSEIDSSLQAAPPPMKAYFIPQLRSILTGETEIKLICNAIKALDLPDEKMTATPSSPLFTSALTMLETYLAIDETKLRAECLAFDCIDPSQSRLKIYLRSRHTSLRSAQDVFTLGGRLTGPNIDAGLSVLCELWGLLFDLPRDHKDDDPLPLNNHRSAGILFNAELRPGKPTPEIQVYLPVRHYARTDLAVAEGLATYFHRQGWHHLAASYVHDLRERFPSHAIDTQLGTHTYVSYSFKKGKPYVTVYYNPKVYS